MNYTYDEINAHAWELVTIPYFMSSGFSQIMNIFLTSARPILFPCRAVLGNINLHPTNNHISVLYFCDHDTWFIILTNLSTLVHGLLVESTYRIGYIVGITLLWICVAC